MSEQYPNPQPDESVFILQSTGESSELSPATITGIDGPKVGVKIDSTQGSHYITHEHKSNVFTQIEVAQAANELLPAPADGEERLLSSALELVVEDADKKQEVIIRLAGIALGRRMNAERHINDYGMRSVENMVGSPQEWGSNMWKVEDLISMSQEHADVTNTLILALPQTDELAHLSSMEAETIKDKILDANRQALNQIYDYYDVSFSNAQVYELTLPDGRTQRTSVYPSATESLYFVENVVDNQTAPAYVQISTKAPVLSLDEGYIRVA